MECSVRLMAGPTIRSSLLTCNLKLNPIILILGTPRKGPQDFDPPGNMNKKRWMGLSRGYFEKKTGTFERTEGLLPYVIGTISVPQSKSGLRHRVCYFRFRAFEGCKAIHAVKLHAKPVPKLLPWANIGEGSISRALVGSLS